MLTTNSDDIPHKQVDITKSIYEADESNLEHFNRQKYVLPFHLSCVTITHHRLRNRDVL